MKREEAKEFMWVENHKNPSVVKWQHHKTIRELVENLIDQIFDNHEEQLKAKDEEIKGLWCRIYHAEGYISDLHNNPKDKKFYDKKARSIVAMLFWEWRKVLRESDENGVFSEFSDGDYWYIKAKEEAFRQAHKMLKDNQ